jgi:hypothetical protein
MQRLSSRFLIIALSAWAIAACSTTTPSPPATREPQESQASLPVKVEPSFRRISSGMLPSGTQVTYLLTSRSIDEALRNHFPALRADGGKLNPGWEDLVLSNETPYRRMMFYYNTRNDLEAKSMHGPCGQSILVWFTLQGEIAGIYTARKSCPL